MARIKLNQPFWSGKLRLDVLNFFAVDAYLTRLWLSLMHDTAGIGFAPRYLLTTASSFKGRNGFTLFSLNVGSEVTWLRVWAFIIAGNPVQFAMNSKHMQMVIRPAHGNLQDVVKIICFDSFAEGHRADLCLVLLVVMPDDAASYVLIQRSLVDNQL